MGLQGVLIAFLASLYLGQERFLKLPRLIFG